MAHKCGICNYIEFSIKIGYFVHHHIVARANKFDFKTKSLIGKDVVACDFPVFCLMRGFW